MDLEQYLAQKKARASGGGLATPAEEIGEKAGRAALQALPLASRANDRRFNDALDEIEDPEVRRDVRASGEFAGDRLKDTRKEAQRAAYLAKRAGNAELADEIKEKGRAARRGEDNKTLVDHALGGASTLFKVLDAPHHLVRQVTTKAFGDDKDIQLSDLVTGNIPKKKELYDRDISAEEWTQNVRKAEQRGGVKGALASAALLAPRALGVAGAATVGTALGTVGALSDIPSLMRGEQTTDDVARNFKTTVEETGKDFTDLGLTIETDPTSFVSFGAGGAAKTAGGTALRAATKAGLSREAAELLSSRVARLAAHSAGSTKANPKVIEGTFANAFKKAGLSPADGQKAAREAFGEAGEFFGRGQLEAHLPLMSGKGVSLGAITGKDYAAGKAIKKVADPLLAKAGLRPAFDQSKGIAKAMSRAARGKAAIREAASNEQLEKMLQGLPEGHKLNDPKVREQILTRHMDPSFDEVPWDQMSTQEQSHFAAQGWSRDKDGIKYGLRPKDFVDANDLDTTFGPGSKQFADNTRKWFGDHADELQRSGALDKDQLAFNPVSKQYTPRYNEPTFGALEDVVARNNRQGGGKTNIQHARKDGGFLSPDTAEKLGYAKREKDFLKIAPQYSRQSARAATKSEFEQRIFKEFAVDQGVASKLNIRHKPVQVNGKTKFIPADIANITSGTFDEGMTTLARLARTNGLDSTPMGRGLIKVLETYSGAAQRFKGLVLKTPAYHAVNLTDDTVKMMSDGMQNPIGYLSKANKLIKGDKVKVAGKEFSLSDANAHNIGIDAAVRFETKGAKMTERRFQDALDQRGTNKSPLRTRARQGYEKADQFSNTVGEAWENRAKIAHWLYRLERGDSPANAARRTFEVLIDYGDRSRLDHVMGWFMPFVKYAKESPKVTARLAARNPGALNALDRGLTFMGEDNGKGNAPPQHVRERGRYVQLPKRGREVVGNFREMLGGSKDKKGLSMGFVPRLAPYDSFKPIEEFTRGNVDPLMMMAGPMSKAAFEYASEKDVLTKQPMRRPDSPLDMFPAGTPIVPDWAEADAGNSQEAPENPWLSRYVSPFVTNPMNLLLANTAINRAQDDKGAISTFGGHRPYTGRNDPRDVQAMSAMKMGVGHPFYETTPADEYNAIADLPEIQSLMSNMAGQKKAAKAEKKADQRAKRKAKR